MFLFTDIIADTLFILFFNKTRNAACQVMKGQKAQIAVLKLDRKTVTMCLNVKPHFFAEHWSPFYVF